MKNKRELELYIHIPFCARKCEYCDFLSGIATKAGQKQYVDKLIEEIHYQSANCREYVVTTIFIGGGTPSILEGEWIKGIMKAVDDGFTLRDGMEVTIEVNPGTVDEGKLKAYREAGINRISLGLQSADDRELKALGRIHTFDEFLKSYQRVRQAGFANVNVDLMSALPGQTFASWKNTLKKVVMLKPEHISAYSLIIEEGTPFYEKYHASFGLLPDEDMERDMYYETKSYLQQHGYERYEISNYARAGYECRHNIGYWTGVEYLGLGLGASSFMHGCRFYNERDLGAYLGIGMFPDSKEVLHKGLEVLSLQEKMEEFMFLGLRLMEGVTDNEFVSRFGHNIWEVYGDVIQKLELQGLLGVHGHRVYLTERGVDLSNFVMGQFLMEKG